MEKRRMAAWTLTLLFLAVNLLVAVPAMADDTPQRVAVYQETFESGIGDFKAQGGEIKLTREVDQSGNHYIMIAINPDKAEAVATTSLSFPTVVAGERNFISGRFKKTSAE